MSEARSNDPQEILTQALEEMKEEAGASFDADKVNLAELERKTGISRSKLRRYKDNGFVIPEHARKGIKATTTVLTGFTGVIDDCLSKNITNAVVICEKITALGYKGHITQVRVYIEQHHDLIPPKRHIVSPQGNRGRRYHSAPGESYQMDWGFITVENEYGTEYRIACFAMICHHCGMRYVEFFPNAKQENLFIGMIHAFFYMGVPEFVLTDNMKSVVIERDFEGKPLWQHDYEAFMTLVGFKTKLCKPRHPFTKGSVERLIRFVKDNFVIGRSFSTITDFNIQAREWCGYQNGIYHRAVDCIPSELHTNACLSVAKPLESSHELNLYLCPERVISFDGFISYDGRRFGVPYWYDKRTARIQRVDYDIFIYDTSLTQLLTKHRVTWSRKDSFCPDQYVKVQPEEHPTSPITAKVLEISIPEPDPGFSKFNFERGLWDD